MEVRVKDRSETTSLRGGYLLETRLSDVAVIYGRVLDGKVRGLAQGPVLVDPSATEKFNSVELGRGVVLGGGIARESRSVGLYLSGAEATNMTPEQLRNAVVKPPRWPTPSTAASARTSMETKRASPRRSAATMSTWSSIRPIRTTWCGISRF